MNVWRKLAVIAGMLAVTGCGSSTTNLYEKFPPAEAAAAAVKEFDGDHDGKISKTELEAAPGLAAGAELYLAPGALGRSLPWQQQDNRLFATLDVDRKPWVFNLGIGRALTDAADRWTLKAIFEVPL